MRRDKICTSINSGAKKGSAVLTEGEAIEHKLVAVPKTATVPEKHDWGRI